MTHLISLRLKSVTFTFLLLEENQYHLGAFKLRWGINLLFSLAVM